MKFLIVVQDLRISGTSEGIVSRSFISKLKKCYPTSLIDVVYLKSHQYDDQLHLLPVNHLKEYFIDRRVPLYIKWINWVYWRLFQESLNQLYVIRGFKKCLKKINYKKYDHIFIRSSGIEHETILGTMGLPILKEAIVNFHDAYPYFWDTGTDKDMNKLELFKLAKMYKIVRKAKACISPSQTLSEDLEYLFGSTKKFYTVPHQFDRDVFEIKPSREVRKKSKKYTISYHGAVEFARNIEIVLDAYKNLVENNIRIKEETEFVLRLRGSRSREILEKYGGIENLILMSTTTFCTSSYEQMNEADIVIVVENCAPHSNILLGKTPFLSSLRKPLLSISPERSELRRIISEKKYIASCTDSGDVERKLKNLINECFLGKEVKPPFGEYFEKKYFEKSLKRVFQEINI